MFNNLTPLSIIRYVIPSNKLSMYILLAFQSPGLAAFQLLP
jgi:hypothetical protein